MLTNVIGIKFKIEGKVYNFDACDHILHKNDQVIVNTENGLSLGVVVTDVKRREDHELPPNLKPVVRMVTEDDLRIKEENKRLAEDAKKFCLGKIKDRQLAMKLITVDYLFDRSKIIFYFTADTRIDFRELVKDLVQKFKTRIELKQIGARQEAGIIKGMAICGRPICCAGILQNLERVTVKMAKEQSMSLNPEKISGLCGRLMCCLSFERESYAGAKKSATTAAKSESKVNANNPSPEGKKITAPAKTGEGGNSDSSNI